MGTWCSRDDSADSYHYTWTPRLCSLEERHMAPLYAIAFDRPDLQHPQCFHDCVAQNPAIVSWLLVYHNSTVIGFLSLYTSGSDIIISNLAVALPYDGKRIASEMMDRAKRKVHSLEHSRG